MTHLIVLTSNCCGVLARIASIVSASGINIQTASAYPIGDSELSMIHLRIVSERVQAERIRRKLARLVDVLEARTEYQQEGAVVHLGFPQSAALSQCAPAGSAQY